MPVYEYQCKACSREFEYQQRMADPDKTTCEVCGGALDRLISRTAFSLKGGGWYKDLYASPKPEAASKPDAGTATPADTSSAAPAAKSSESSAPASGASSGGSASSAAAAKAP